MQQLRLFNLPWEHDAKTDHNTPVSTTNLEQTIGGKRMAKKENPRFDSPVRIHVLSRRYKLADSDGISAKAAIDGLVHAGILTDDTTEFVKEVTYGQEKISRKEEEETVITIEALPTIQGKPGDIATRTIQK